MAFQNRIKRLKTSHDSNNNNNNLVSPPALVSLPGGGLRCTDPECTGPLLCPSKNIQDLAEPGLKCHKYDLTVKVRVLTKSDVREGLYHMTANRWAMFDMHVLNAAGEEKEIYVTVFHHAREFHQLIQEGKVYIFSKVVLTQNIQRYSQMEAEFSVTFGKESTVLPVPVEPRTLQELAMDAVGVAVSRLPKEEGIPYLASIPRDILEKIFHGRHLPFEAICSMYYTNEFNSQIPSSELACYIMTRETCLLHASEYHKYPNLYQDLHCVFDDITPFHFTTQDFHEKEIKKLLETENSISRDFPIVKTLEIFKRQFSNFTRNILDGLNWKNLFCAGGAVLAALTPLPTNVGVRCKTDAEIDAAMRDYYETGAYQDSDVIPELEETIRNYYRNTPCPYWKSDIDIFLYGLNTEEEYQTKLGEVIKTITTNIDGPTFLLHTPNTVSIVAQYPHRIIQLVTIPACSPAHVLARFDIDCVCVGFDGEKVWASQRGIRAITKRYNLIDADRVHKAYAYRLYKYALRGYSAGIPFENITTDALLNSIEQGYAQTNLFGRLILFSVKMKKQDFLDMSSLKGFTVSPYSANIPWGPTVSFQQAFDHMERETELKIADTFENLVELYKEDRVLSGCTWEAKQVRPTFTQRREREAWLEADSLLDESPYYQRISGPIFHLLPK